MHIAGFRIIIVVQYIFFKLCSRAVPQFGMNELLSVLYEISKCHSSLFSTATFSKVTGSCVAGETLTVNDTEISPDPFTIMSL